MSDYSSPFYSIPFSLSSGRSPPQKFHLPKKKNLLSGNTLLSPQLNLSWNDPLSESFFCQIFLPKFFISTQDIQMISQILDCGRCEGHDCSVPFLLLMKTESGKILCWRSELGQKFLFQIIFISLPIMERFFSNLPFSLQYFIFSDL